MYFCHFLDIIYEARENLSLAGFSLPDFATVDSLLRYAEESRGQTFTALLREHRHLTALVQTAVRPNMLWWITLALILSLVHGKAHEEVNT